MQQFELANPEVSSQLLHALTSFGIIFHYRFHRKNSSANLLTQGQYSMNFGGLENPDVLDNFDFDSFLQSNDEFPEFDPTGLSFGAPEGVETGAEGA